MGLLDFAKKHLNPVELALNTVGGTVGRVANIGFTIVNGIARGQSFGYIMRNVLQDVAALAVTTALVGFTGGTGAIFVNTFLTKAQGILGEAAAKVASSQLSKPVANWFSQQILKFSGSLTEDVVKQQMTQTVLDVAGLEDPNQRMTQEHIARLRRSNEFAAVLQQQFDEMCPWNVDQATAKERDWMASSDGDSWGY